MNNLRIEWEEENQKINLRILVGNWKLSVAAQGRPRHKESQFLLRNWRVVEDIEKEVMILIVLLILLWILFNLEIIIYKI